MRIALKQLLFLLTMRPSICKLYDFKHCKFGFCFPDSTNIVLLFVKLIYQDLKLQ